jgi:hypothetical protein
VGGYGRGGRGVSGEETDLEIFNGTWEAEGNGVSVDRAHFPDSDHVSIDEEENSDEPVITLYDYNDHIGGQLEENEPSWSQLEHVDSSQPIHWEYLHAPGSPVHENHYTVTVRNEETENLELNLNGHYFY